MAKVTKSLLKSIVKECLVEILSEGLAGSEDALLESKTSVITNTRSTRRAPPKAPRRPALDTVSYNAAVQEKVSTITSDPMMAEIFQDTAMTTLVEQKEAKSRQSYQPADSAARVAYDNDPSDLFSGANNWAALAFSDGAKK